MPGPTDKKPAVLPTREDILRFVRESPVPVGKREIAQAFGVKGTDRVQLKQVLRELRSDGALARGTRNELMDPAALPEYLVIEVIGTNRDGDTIARPARWNPDGGEAPPTIYVPAVPGQPAPGPADRLLVTLRRRGKDEYDATIVRRVGSGPRRLLGVFEAEHADRGPGVVRPTDRKLRFEIAIDHGARGGALPNDVVWVEQLGGPLARRGRIVERMGSLDEPRTVSLIAIAANDIPVDFAPEALALAEDAKAAPLGKRLDLRDVPFVTIDGEDARDFDDAVQAQADDAADNPGGWRLMVAIADVAWYVRAGDALDRGARERGNSVYFPDRVVPMLPEALSNGWCSLRPREDRPVLVAEMRIDAAGQLLGHKFHRALIRSAARLTYDRVQTARDGRPDEELAPLMDAVIAPLYGAYVSLLAARKARGTLDLDLPERKVGLDEAGRIAEIGVRQRFDSHRLIEEFMILANVAAAETLEERRMPCMYRVHDKPDGMKMESLRQFLATLDIGLQPGGNVRPKDLQRVLEKAAGKPFERLVNETVLRSQSQAVYSPDNLGHFGLALRRYAHFTSPIRRYADLLVHRALVAGLGLGEGGLDHAEGADFPAIGEQISQAERRAIAAERAAMDRYMAAYMSERVGAEFDGRVTGVTRFGLFVELNDTGANGLVPIKSLGDEYFDHDEPGQALVGRRSRTVWRMGDTVRVRLHEAQIATGSLVFVIMERIGPASKPPGRPGPRRDGKTFRDRQNPRGRPPLPKSHHRR